MSTAPVSLGFLQPDQSRLIAVEPEVTYGHGLAVVQGRAMEWDYHARVRVEWSITVDLAGILADCGLGVGARVDAVISWHSTWTNLRGAGTIAALVDGRNNLGIDIPGEVLGGTLNLTVTVTLGEAGLGAAVLAPRRPGSPLWSRRSSVVLEGAAARMPVMAVDFAATGRGRENGVWLLECDHDLTASVAGALLLYLNTAHSDVQSLLDRPADPAAGALARFIAFDVTRQLVVRALQHDELDERHRYDEGTLGDLFLTLFATHLPGRTLDHLRREYEDDPGEIEAELLARAWESGR
ncbi:hypothetical protein [Micromonospora sp. NPDC048830]|uniref:hypothetical protein n=1 Tax=Micromonospora sp. NPDC048830 TaxID=3364257 RepID=UPI003724BBB8